MAESITIQKDPVLDNSQDYAFLREKGQEYIAALGSKIWSDYNIHDPGITILEMLAYAITDLGYRIDYNIEDILSLTPDKKYFHTAREILTNSPVTINDFRKVIIDCAGIQNAWLTKTNRKADLEATPPIVGQECPIYIDLKKSELSYSPFNEFEEINPPVYLNGLYRILLEFEDSDEFGDLNNTLIDWEVGDIEVENDFPSWTELRERPDAELIREWILFGENIHPITILENEDGELFEFDSGRSAYKVRTRIAFTLPYKSDGLFYSIDLDFFVDFEGSLRVADESGGISAMVADGELIDFYQGKVRETLQTVERVECKLHEARSFDEDYFKIDTLKTEEVVICADIELDPTADVNEVQAEILLKIGFFITPPVNWYRLQEMFDKGFTSDEIFEGPALSSGFIDPTELNSAVRLDRVRASDIVQIIMDVPGVVAVKEILIADYLEGEFVDTGQAWELILSGGEGYIPRLSVDKSKFSFYKSGLPFIADKAKTENILMELKAREIKPRLKDVNLDIEVPLGEDRNIGRYHSIQNDFPLVYGVGQEGVPERDGDLRQAQSRQLKAFLAFFDQILANYFSQLANVRELFSMDSAIEETYFYQLLVDSSDLLQLSQLKDQTEIDEIDYIEDEQELKNFKQLYEDSKGIKNLRELYDLYRDGQTNAGVRYTDIEANLSEITEDQELFIERRNKFLDHLLARFNESFAEYSLLMFTLDGDKAIDELVKDKLAFLNDYPKLSSLRGAGFNYRPQCCECGGGTLRFTLRWEGPGPVDIQVGEDVTGGTFYREFLGVDTGDEVLIEADPYSTLPESVVLVSGLTGSEDVTIDTSCDTDFRGDYGDFSILSYDIDPSWRLWNTDNVTGLKRRVARLLGVDDINRKSLACDLFVVEPIYENDTAVFRFIDPVTGETIMTSSEEYPAGEDYIKELRSDEEFIGEKCAKDMIDRAIYYTELGYLIKAPELQGFPHVPDNLGYTYDWFPTNGVTFPTGSDGSNPTLSPDCSTTYTVTTLNGTVEINTQIITVYVEDCSYPEEYAAVSESSAIDGDFPTAVPIISTDLAIDGTAPLGLSSQYAVVTDADAWGAFPGEFVGTDHTPGGGTYFQLCASNTQERPWFQPATVEKDVSYHFSLWFRNCFADNTVPAAELPNIRLAVTDGNGLHWLNDAQVVSVDEGWVQVAGVYDSVINGAATFEAWVFNNDPGSGMVYGLDDVEIVEIEIPETHADEFTIAAGEPVEVDANAYRFLVVNPCWDPEDSINPMDEVVAISRGYMTIEERDAAAEKAEADIIKYCASEGFHVLEHLLLRPKFKGTPPVNQSQEEGEELIELNYVWQSFTPSIDGNLCLLEVFGGFDVPGTLRIYEGSGTLLDLIHTQEFVPITNELKWTTFNLVVADATTEELVPATIPVVADQEYRFEFEVDPSYPTGMGIGFLYNTATGSYERGESFIGPEADLLFRVCIDDGETYTDRNLFLPVCVNLIEEEEAFNCDITDQVINCSTGENCPPAGALINLNDNIDFSNGLSFSRPTGRAYTPPIANGFDSSLIDTYTEFLETLKEDELRTLLTRLRSSLNPQKTFVITYNRWLDSRERNREREREREAPQIPDRTQSYSLPEFFKRYLDGLRSRSKEEELHELVGILSTDQQKEAYELVSKFNEGGKLSGDFSDFLGKMTEQERVNLLLTLRLHISGRFEEKAPDGGVIIPQERDGDDDPEAESILMELLVYVARRGELTDVEILRLLEALDNDEKRSLLDMLLRIKQGEKPESEEEEYIYKIPESTRDRLTIMLAKSLARTPEREGTGKTISGSLEKFMEEYEQSGEEKELEELRGEVKELGEKTSDRLLAQTLKYQLGGEAEKTLTDSFNRLADESIQKIVLSLSQVDKSGYAAERSIADQNSRTKIIGALQNIGDTAHVSSEEEVRKELDSLTEIEKDQFLAELYRYRSGNTVEVDFRTEARKVSSGEMDLFFNELILAPSSEKVDVEVESHKEARIASVMEFLKVWSDPIARSQFSKSEYEALFEDLSDAAAILLGSELIRVAAGDKPGTEVGDRLAKMKDSERGRLLDQLEAYKDIDRTNVDTKNSYEYEWPEYLRATRSGLIQVGNLVNHSTPQTGTHTVCFHLKSIAMEGKGIGDDWQFQFVCGDIEKVINLQINGGQTRDVDLLMFEVEIPASQENHTVDFDIHAIEIDPSFNDVGHGGSTFLIDNKQGTQVFGQFVYTPAIGGEIRTASATHEFVFEAVITPVFPDDMTESHMQRYVPALRTIDRALDATEAYILSEDPDPDFKELNEYLRRFVNEGNELLNGIYAGLKTAFPSGCDATGDASTVEYVLERFMELIKEVSAATDGEVTDDDDAKDTCRDAFFELMETDPDVDGKPTVLGGGLYFDGSGKDTLVEVPKRSDFNELTQLLNKLLEEEFGGDPERYTRTQRQNAINKLIEQYARVDVDTLSDEEKETWLRRLLNEYFGARVAAPTTQGKRELVDLMLAKAFGVNPDKLTTEQKFEAVGELITKTFGVDPENLSGNECMEYLDELLDTFGDVQGIPRPEPPVPNEPRPPVPDSPVPEAPVTSPSELIEEILIILFPQNGSPFPVPPQVGPIRNPIGCFAFILRDSDNNILLNSPEYDYLSDAYEARDLAIEEDNRYNKDNYSLETTADGEFFYRYSIEDPVDATLTIELGTSPTFATSDEMMERLLVLACIDCDPPEDKKESKIPEYCEEDADPYSFRATVLMPSWPRKFRSPGFRDLSEKILRLEAPAHVALKICWIDRCQMEAFEAAYKAWLEVNGDCRKSPAEVAPYLNTLIELLNNLRNVFPGQTLHDCESEGGAAGRIILDNSSIGSL